MRPLFEPDRGLLIPWPWASEAAEAARALLPTRGDRLGSLERWMPTIIFCGVLVGLVCLMLLVHALATPSGSSPASAPAVAQPEVTVFEAAPPPPSPIQVTIQVLQPNYSVIGGDTLSIIAQRYNTTVQALRGINNLPDDALLRIGQRLFIP